MNPKRTKAFLQGKQKIVDDIKQPVAVRKQAFDELRDNQMNPFPNSQFDPETFDAMAGTKNYEFAKRARVDPPRRLPNAYGLKPKEILDGQLVGMYESKQDLYLLIHALYERVADLEDTLNNS